MTFKFFAALLTLCTLSSGCNIGAKAVDDSEDPSPDAPALPPTPAPLIIKSAVAAGFSGHLVDAAGSSLYIFLADHPGLSTCDDPIAQGCDTTWVPVLIPNGDATGANAQGALLSSLTRNDGSTQATYNGWPLYYYVGDTGPNTANGENINSFGNVWTLIDPSGTSLVPPPAVVTVKSDTAASFADHLVDSTGVTLYIFSGDTPGTSSCDDPSNVGCDLTWIPYLIPLGGSVIADSNAQISSLAFTTRDDGSSQVTYNGWPLYYYAGDTGPDTANGEGITSFGGTWTLATPAGNAL